MESYLRGRTPHYAAVARTYLRHLGENYGRALKMRRKDWNVYFTDIEHNGVSGKGPLATSTLDGIYNRLQAYVRFLNDNETPRAFPMRPKHWKSVSSIRGEHELLTDAEADLIETVLPQPWDTVFRVQLRSGARPGEILRLKRAEVIDKDNHFALNLTRTKTYPRVVTLAAPDAVQKLRSYLEVGPASGYLFPAPREPTDPVSTDRYSWHMRKAKAKLVAKGVLPPERKTTPYALRHVRTTAAMRGRVPIATITDQLGTSVRMLERNYAHLTNKDHSDRILAYEGVEGLSEKAKLQAEYLEEVEAEHESEVRELKDVMLAALRRMDDQQAEIEDMKAKLFYKEVAEKPKRPQPKRKKLRD